MRATFAELARRRVRLLPLPPETEELQQAKLDFFNALVDRNQREAHRARAVMDRYARPERPQTDAERVKSEPRVRAVARLIREMRDLRDEEARGIVRPQPTPEQQAEAEATKARFKRWMAGDDSAGPFE